jgi:LPS-assembly lipoprotein
MMTKRLPVSRMVVALGLSAGLSALSGCGFQPLYAQNGVVDRLAHIDMETPDTRTGFYLRQDLISKLGDGDGPRPLSLKISIVEKRYEIGLNSFGTATRFEISNTVTYTLTEKATHKELLKKAFVDSVTYDSTDNAYAGISAQTDGQKRAATSIADHINTDLTLFFHDGK